jgi:hypothetical protein
MFLSIFWDSLCSSALADSFRLRRPSTCQQWMVMQGVRVNCNSLCWCPAPGVQHVCWVEGIREEMVDCVEICLKCWVL